MQKRKLISILEIIKNNKEEYEKLELNLNNIFELDDNQIAEILNCKKENNRFFKIITYLDKTLLNDKQKSQFLKVIDNSKKELSIDEFLEIYNSVKSNKKIFEYSIEAFSKYMANLDYILNIFKEPYQLKYSIKALSNPTVFNSTRKQYIIDTILYANEEYQAECSYRITNYPNIMKSEYLLTILEMIKNSEIKEQAENVIMLGNSAVFNKNKNNLEIMKLISCAKGKYQAMYGQLAATSPIISKVPSSLYLISLITTAQEDFQSEYTYKALCTDLIYRFNNTKLADLIFNSKSRFHAMSLYNICKNYRFLNKENSYEMLKTISESNFSSQVLYAAEIVSLSEELRISDKALEKSIKIICNTKIEETPKYIYNALTNYRKLKREDLMSVLRILSKSETEEDVKQIYKIFKETLEKSTKETFNKSFREQIKIAVHECEEKYLEEIMNEDVEEILNIVKKSTSSELEKNSIVKVKKINKKR